MPLFPAARLISTTQRNGGLLALLFPSRDCHSHTLLVHRSSVVHAIYPAHDHLCSATCLTKSLTSVRSLTHFKFFRWLEFTPSILLSIAVVFSSVVVSKAKNRCYAPIKYFSFLSFSKTFWTQNMWDFVKLHPSFLILFSILASWFSYFNIMLWPMYMNDWIVLTVSLRRFTTFNILSCTTSLAIRLLFPLLTCPFYFSCSFAVSPFLLLFHLYLV